MSFVPTAVIDADAHVIESDLTLDYLEPAEQKFRPKIIQDPQRPHLK